MVVLRNLAAAAADDAHASSSAGKVIQAQTAAIGPFNEIDTGDTSRLIVDSSKESITCALSLSLSLLRLVPDDCS